MEMEEEDMGQVAITVQTGERDREEGKEKREKVMQREIEMEIDR